MTCRRSRVSGLLTARRGRLKAFDRLLIAGCMAGAAYLVAANMIWVHGEVAVMLGVLGGGFALGRITRLPSLRSPIVWRRGRR
jgi:hypothetical protein